MILRLFVRFCKRKWHSFGTVLCQNCTLEELAILKELLKNPSITQKELAGIIGKSERSIKTRTVEMQEKGLIRRENGKRNGRWEVLVII